MMGQSDDEILSALRAYVEIDVLAVFGSRATGRARPDSDLDVAVLAASTDATVRRRLQAGIAASLARLAPSGRVDVVFFDEACELLRQGILETARVLICKAPARWREWRVRTMREHGDREHARRLLRDAQRRRLERGERGDRSGRAIESLERTRGLHR